MSSDQPLFDLINDMNNKTYKFGARDKLDYGMKGYTNGMDHEMMNGDDATVTRMRSKTNINNRLHHAHRPSFSNLKLRRGSRHGSQTAVKTKHRPSVSIRS